MDEFTRNIMWSEYNNEMLKENFLVYADFVFGKNNLLKNKKPDDVSWAFLFFMYQKMSDLFPNGSQLLLHNLQKTIEFGNVNNECLLDLLYPGLAFSDKVMYEDDPNLKEISYRSGTIIQGQSFGLDACYIEYNSLPNHTDIVIQTDRSEIVDRISDFPYIIPGNENNTMKTIAVKLKKINERVLPTSVKNLHKLQFRWSKRSH